MRYPIYTEAEYIVMAEGVKGALDISAVSDALPRVDVYWSVRGQQGAKNPLSSPNSKHIDVWYHFLRQLAANGDSSAQYIW